MNYAPPRTDLDRTIECYVPHLGASKQLSRCRPRHSQTTSHHHQRIKQDCRQPTANTPGAPFYDKNTIQGGAPRRAATSFHKLNVAKHLSYHQIIHIIHQPTRSGGVSTPLDRQNSKRQRTRCRCCNFHPSIELRVSSRLQAKPACQNYINTTWPCRRRRLRSTRRQKIKKKWLKGYSGGSVALNNETDMGLTQCRGPGAPHVVWKMLFRKLPFPNKPWLYALSLAHQNNKNKPSIQSTTGSHDWSQHNRGH